MFNLIDERQMAKRLCLKPRTLRKYHALKVIPFIKFGRRVLYDPVEVLAVMVKFKQGVAQ